MQRRADTLLFSASDLVNFLECRRLTELDRLALDTPLQKTLADEQTVLIRRKGERHEEAYLDSLRESGREVFNVKQAAKSLDQAVQVTTAAMRGGAEIIYQAAFRDGPFMGYADFLRRVEQPSQLGSWSYELIDTKLARSPRSKFLVQLAFYAELLSRVQGVMPARMHVVLGDGREQSFAVKDALFYVQNLKSRVLAHVEAGRETYPEPRPHCEMCHWRELCETKRTADDHLSGVASISRSHVRLLEAAGIGTVAALARSSPTAPAQINPKVYARLQHQAALQLKARETGQRYVEPIEAVNSPAPGELRGFARLPAPAAGDLFFDMEGDPLAEGGLEYLFGLLWREGEREHYKSFWAHDRQEEKKAFEAFIDFVTDHLNRHPDAYIYHYAAYEKTALRDLMTGHGTREAEVDRLLREDRLVDLYAVVRESIRVSEDSYSLKNIELFFRPKRSGSVQNAGASVVFYEKWREDRANINILADIESYNRDDVVATYQLRQWLLGLRPKELPWARYGRTNQSEETPSKEIEVTLARYQAWLCGSLPADPRTWSKDEQIRELIFQLLDFHRRAAKPQWWRMFDRQKRSGEHQSLLDDAECIADAQLDLEHPPTPEKRSIRYTYTYPEQSIKLKTGDNVVLVLPDALPEVAGFTIDDEARRVSFKLGAKRLAPPPQIDIGLGKPIDSSKLRAAVFRYADAFQVRDQASGLSRYKAIDRFLRREIPNITGLPAGQPIILVNSSPDEVRKVLTERVQNLDHSYLFIQGPPGTGKTETAADIILALIAAGKKVGVTSNSHKAIVNLLRRIDKKADDTGQRFRGIKKSSSDDEDDMAAGRQIKDTTKVQEVLSGSYDLVAGTAWLFAEPDLDQKLDYVFVDEAGQIALANLIAIATSARNLVLLGDQMQLAQPIQGKHPGKSGLSSLDYLLDGTATIAADRGAFLATTWRLHPAVCSFISEAVYDGRLIPGENNARQTLVLSPGYHPALKPAGIVHVPVDHRGCEQESPEEALLIKQIYDSLLEQNYSNAKVQVARISPRNILVVAPYNLQVNRLKRTLPPAAQVGTVDKFQGQEAEVVLFSMTTSSGDDLPRDIEFLFSRNRLNVAISRARCLALIVANPALLEIDCKTPEQVEMVNTLCWIAERFGASAQPSAPR